MTNPAPTWHPLQQVVLSWSGGIDSTACLLSLLAEGYDVRAVSLDLYDERHPSYASREAHARKSIKRSLEGIVHAGKLSFETLPAKFLWEFSAPNLEIPARNKRIIDLLMARCIMPAGLMNLALGEYVGADTWVVQNHVPLYDCDHRALSSYLLLEYGLRYRLISLQDFGESRYKHQRLHIGFRAWKRLTDRSAQEAPLYLSEGINPMLLTTNCLKNVEVDCGACYKCVERSAAFHMLALPDPTLYLHNPTSSPLFDVYFAQMNGRADVGAGVGFVP